MSRVRPATTIAVERTVSMGHRLPSYDGVCAHPHGHNVRVRVELDPLGRFVDFKAVDRALAAVLADLDHAMVLHAADPLLAALRGMGFRTVALSAEPTTEALAQLVYNEMSEDFQVARVTVYETDKYSATASEASDVRRA